MLEYTDTFNSKKKKNISALLDDAISSLKKLSRFNQLVK